MEEQLAGPSPFADALGAWCRRHSSIAPSERSRDEHGIRTVCRHTYCSERSGSDPSVVFSLRARHMGRPDLFCGMKVSIRGLSAWIAVKRGVACAPLPAGLERLRGFARAPSV